MAHIIVVGNEKGGAGKSTVAMHLATALARQGHRVGGLDLDVRQGSLRRYIANRETYLKKAGLDLPGPQFVDLATADPVQQDHVDNPQDAQLSRTVEGVMDQFDFLLLDCPGSHTRLSQLAHMMADTLVTPLNDSFVDFDLLAHIDSAGEEITAPSVYAEMVWTARQRRAEAGLHPIDWIVLRNRLGSQAMINKQKMEKALALLATRIGFRTAAGFHERVIFRELFPKGLTLLDLRDLGKGGLNMSHLAARQELRELVRALNLPGVTPDF